MKINDTEWYPCYLNPSFDEILELAKSGWDTCRILVNQDNNDLIIASGYGNTHTSICERYYLHLGGKRRDDGRVYLRSHPVIDTYILYHDNRIALMNLEDVSGSPRARYDKWPLEEIHLSIIKDLIRESDLSY